MKKSQIPLFVILGFLYWFAGAMMVKFLGELVFTEDNPLSFLMFVLAIPITYLVGPGEQPIYLFISILWQ